MRLPWKWIVAVVGAAFLVAAFVLARASFGAKDAARVAAGVRIGATRAAASRILRELVADAVDKLADARPDSPPAPFDSVQSVEGLWKFSDAEAIRLPSAEPEQWNHFGRVNLTIWRRTGSEKFATGRVPLAELDRRLAADPEVGVSRAKAWSRLLFVDGDGDVVFQRPDARIDVKAKRERAPGRVTFGQQQIHRGVGPKTTDDGLPDHYKDTDEKLVRADWAPVYADAPRLWTLVEVRDQDVVAGVGGWPLEVFGYSVGEMMPWHLALGLGLLLIIASAFFWLPGRSGTEMSVLLRTYDFAKPYAWGIVTAVGVGAVYGASRAYRAIIAKDMVNNVLVDAGPDAEAAIWRIVWMTLVLGAVTAITNYFKEYLQNYYSTAMTADVRIAVARKIVSLPLSFFNRFRSGELLARIERDVSGMRQVLLQVFDKAFVAPFTMVASITAAFIMNWHLALVLFGLPLLVVPVFRIAKQVKKRAAKRQNLLADISHVLFQMLTGIKVVKAFHGEEREAQRLDKANRRYIHEARRIARLTALSESLLDFLQMVGGALVVYAGGQGVLRGDVEVGDLMGFVVVIISVYDAAKDITQVLNKLTDALPSVARVYEILDVENDMKDGARTAPGGALVRGIELRGVRFRYLENDILKGVDLFIPAGKIVAIVGPTGAGKTTLCDLVVRFYDPTEGAVLWDGVDAREYSLTSLASKFAIVTQDAFLFNAPIDENIRYGSENATQSQIEAAAKDANIHDEIEQMEGGYSKVAGERGTSLSGGQRQRITIARALVKDAPVLVLDEATSNLDTHSEKRVQAALAKLMQGRTTIVVAHRLSTIRNADKVVVVDSGRIVEEGAPDDLLKISGGRFRAMYDLQTGDGDGNGAAVGA